MPGPRPLRVGLMDGDGRSGPLLQFEGAAEVVEMSVREEDQREVFAGDAVLLHGVEDLVGATGNACIDENGTVALDEKGVDVAQADRDYDGLLG